MPTSRAAASGVDSPLMLLHGCEAGVGSLEGGMGRRRGFWEEGGHRVFWDGGLEPPGLGRGAGSGRRRIGKGCWRRALLLDWYD